jgi:glycosyltransferase involved in cell wall biosynthesis
LKHILVINPWTGKIGPNTFIEGFVKQNIEEGNKITFLYPYEDSISTSLKTIGCDFHFIKILKLNHISNKYNKILFRLITEILLLFILPTYVIRKKYNLCFVNTEMLSFSLIPISCFIKMSMIVHSLSFNSSGLLVSILFKLQHYAISNYIAVSNAVKQSLLNKGVNKPIHMVYNGLDLTYYENIPTIKKNPCDTIKILSIIHPLPHKGAHYLIDVIKLVISKNKKVHFSIIGWDNTSKDEKYKLKIENRVRQEGLENFIEFKNSTDEIKNEYLKADILLHPSESESFGYVLAEAMAFKIPVVAFNVGGIPEVIENGESGILVEPYNIKEMSESLLLLIGNSKLRASFGKRGLEIVKEKFELKFNIRQILNVLELIEK